MNPRAWADYPDFDFSLKNDIFDEIVDFEDPFEIELIDRPHWVRAILWANYQLIFVMRIYLNAMDGETVMREGSFNDRSRLEIKFPTSDTPMLTSRDDLCAVWIGDQAQHFS